MSERPKALLPLALVLLVTGFASLSRFAAGVRAVDAVGLSGGGFAIGVGFAMIAFGVARRRGA